MADAFGRATVASRFVESPGFAAISGVDGSELGRSDGGAGSFAAAIAGEAAGGSPVGVVVADCDGGFLK